MTTSSTASARGKANRRKGADTERAVARYLRTQGFGHAERAERNGWRSNNHTSLDPGDLLGVPGVVWSVKNDASNRVSLWIDEIEALRNRHGAELALLVVRRRGKADVSQWWVWVSLVALARALIGNGIIGREFHGHVCLELGDLVPMLRGAGYGDSDDEGAA